MEEGTLKCYTLPMVPERYYKPNVFSEQCFSRQLLDLIANKWTALIIYALAAGTKRHSQLKREIGGISQKMLTQTLRRLERDGLVMRTVYAEVPPIVEYELTQLGETVLVPLRDMCAWAEQHRDQIQALRELDQSAANTHT